MSRELDGVKSSLIKAKLPRGQAMDLISILIT